MTDPITTEVIRGGLAAAALEMNRALVRTAFNPLIYEAKDFGLGIVSADGRLWGEAPGLAGFITALPETIRSGLEKHGAGGFHEGDVLIANDPFITGTHISDTSVYAPVFSDGRLVAFAIVMAHWADIGGRSPGGTSPDTTDVYQEGICFTHQRLVAGGQPVTDLFDLIESNVRLPRIVRGDLDAQIAACRQGIERVRRLCERYGVDTVIGAMDDVMARTEAAIRRQIGALPDGVYEERIEMDADPMDPSVTPTLAVQIRIDGDRLRVTFDGTSPASLGPINDPLAECDALCALKGVFAPHAVGNQGHVTPFEFDVPPGLIVSPVRPSPVDSYAYVGVALIELIIRAMAKAMPDRFPASGYQMFGLDIFRVDPRYGEPFQLSDLHDGGAGGRPDHDGPVLIFAGDGDTPNTPVEVIETRYPLRVERHELLPELGGAGRFRGGAGVARDFRILEDGIFVQLGLDNVDDTLGKGLAGGSDGQPGFMVAFPGTEREETFQRRLAYWGPLSTGDVVSARSGGGGGWGTPHDREPERVAADVRDGYITRGSARDIYAVILDPAGNVDQAATRSLRAQQSKARTHRRLNGSS